MARILLINDEPDLLQMCRMVLQSEGHDVTVTSDTSHVVELAAKTADIVVLDLVMPGTNGEAVLARLRESPETRSIPVVIMSALHDAKDRAAALGADGFVGKPFEPNALFETVDRALAASRAGDRDQRVRGSA